MQSPITEAIKWPTSTFRGCAKGTCDALKHKIAEAPYEASIIGAWCRSLNILGLLNTPSKSATPANVPIRISNQMK